jgi:hypothetical protein
MAVEGFRAIEFITSKMLSSIRSNFRSMVVVMELIVIYFTGIIIIKII